MVINLKDALEVLVEIGQRPTYKGLKVGITQPAIAPVYEVGRVVLFKHEVHPSDAHPDRAGKPTGYITIETPMNAHQREEQRSKGSLLRTTATMVCVPETYVEEIVVN